MIPDALISCGYLLLGSGWCIYRLAKYSNDSLSRILPQFIIASIGIFAIGARSTHALVYNIFWRSYPIDPREIVKELAEVKNKKNIVDSFLPRIGIASLVHSLYYHYQFYTTGALVVVTLTVYETLCFIEEIVSTRQTNAEASQDQNLIEQISALVNDLPCSPGTFWILSMEFLGRSVGNHYIRLATVPYALSIWAFSREGFYQGWSMTHTINDYMMLSYIIIITEALCQMPIDP